MQMALETIVELQRSERMKFVHERGKEYSSSFIYPNRIRVTPFQDPTTSRYPTPVQSSRACILRMQRRASWVGANYDNVMVT